MGWFEDNGYVDRSGATPAPANQGPLNHTMGADILNPDGSGGIYGAPAGGIGGVGRTSGAAPDLGALQAIFSKYPPTNDGFLQAVAEADATFGKGVWGHYIPHDTGSRALDKIMLPNGVSYDIMIGAGGANPSWATNWTPETPGLGGGGAVGALGGMMGQDPSYEWRLKEGQKALERSAAAKGTLLTGGTLKALNDYAQNAASTEFGNIFGRNLSLAQLGLNATQGAASLGNSYSGNLGNLAGNQSQLGGDYLLGAGNARAGATQANATNWGNTIGQLGTMLAPGVTDWLSKPRGGAKAGSPNSPGFEFF